MVQRWLRVTGESQTCSILTVVVLKNTFAWLLSAGIWSRGKKNTFLGKWVKPEFRVDQGKESVASWV